MAENEGEIGDVIWISTNQRIGGIDLRNVPVVEEAVDWQSVSSLTFDFSYDISGTNIPLFMDHFVLDSKLYLAGGFKPFCHSNFRSSSSSGYPSYGIYEFDFDENTKKPFLSVSDSFPKLERPETLAESFVANVSGYVYFSQTLKSLKWKTGFLVLDSKHREWISDIELPTCIVKERYIHYFFVLHDKLFAECYDRTPFNGIRNPRVFSFDPKTAYWKEEPYEENYNNFFYTFKILFDGWDQFLFPKITVDVPGFSNDNNCRIMLASAFYAYGHRADPDEPAGQFRVRIYALMVNQKGLVLYQPLDECLEGIQFTSYAMRHLFLDLGNGKVCALVQGPAEECRRANNILSISVFSLEPFPFPYTDIDMDNPPREQKFLSINILNKNVYTAFEKDKDKDRMPMLKAFVWPSPKNTKMSRKKKETSQ